MTYDLRKAGKRLTLIVATLAAAALSDTAAAQDPEPMFRIRVGQQQGDAEFLQRGEWACASDVLRKGKCRREVSLTIDGSPRSVLLTLHAETAEANKDLKAAGIRVTTEQSGLRIALESGKRKFALDQGGRLARQVELWETAERARAAVHDLAYRKPIRKLTTITLIIERQPG